MRGECYPFGYNSEKINPVKVKLIERNCLHCKEPFTTYLNGKQKFCNSHCRKIAIIKNSNENWKDKGPIEINKEASVRRGEYLKRKHCAKEYTFFLKKFNGIRG